MPSYNWLEAYPEAEKSTPPTADKAPQSKATSWLDDYAPEPNQPANNAPTVSTLEAGVSGLEDGLLFGLKDELFASLDAATYPIGKGTGNDGATFSERYEKNVADQRAGLQAAQDQHPVATIAGGIAGGLVPAVASGGSTLLPAALGGAAKQTVGQTVARGAVVGAGYGGAYGLGSAEGDLSERLPGAAEGAAMGALVGGAVPAVIGGGTATANAFRSPNMRAKSQLMRGLERDNITPEQFGTRLDDLEARFPGTAIPADAGGENVKGVLERVANTPGGGRAQVVERLTERQQAQPSRVIDELKAGTGTVKSSHQAIEDAIAERSASAAPLYAAAHLEEVPWSPALEGLMKRPAMQMAYREAQVRAANQGRAFDGQFMEIAADGQVTAKAVPKTGDLDIIKQNLDDQIGGLLRAGEKGKARDIQDIRAQLLGVMDASAPTYAKARAAWAGPSQFMEAVDEGADLLSKNVSAESWAANFAKKTPSEQEGIRIGAVSSIVGKIRNDSSKMADITKYIRSPEGRDKIAALMPDDAARARFTDALDNEINISTMTGRTMGNSATARRAAEQADRDGSVIDLVSAGLTAGSPTGLLSLILKTLPQKAGDHLHARSDKALADALTTRAGFDALSSVSPRTIIGNVTGDATAIASTQGQPQVSRPNKVADGAHARQQRLGQAKADRANRLVDKEQEALSATYKGAPGANRAIRGLRNPDAYATVKIGNGEWRIERKSE